jgi:integrase
MRFDGHLILLIINHLEANMPARFCRRRRFIGLETIFWLASTHPWGVRQICQQLAGEAGIKKQVNPHIWRHSFATDLLDAGTDDRRQLEHVGRNSCRQGEEIVDADQTDSGRSRSMLGHVSLKTTAIYLHVSVRRVPTTQSPLEELVSSQHRKALRDIGACRTTALGGHVGECDQCANHLIASAQGHLIRTYAPHCLAWSDLVLYI